LPLLGIQFLADEKYSSFLHRVKAASEAQPASCLTPGALFLAVGQPERDADHSTFNAEIKNGGALRPFPRKSPSLCVSLSKHRGNSTFTPCRLLEEWNCNTILDLYTRRTSVVNSMPPASLFLGKESRYLFDRRLVESLRQSERCR
jgi:hypothetical protein